MFTYIERDVSRVYLYTIHMPSFTLLQALALVCFKASSVVREVVLFVRFWCLIVVRRLPLKETAKRKSLLPRCGPLSFSFPSFSLSSTHPHSFAHTHAQRPSYRGQHRATFQRQTPA